MEQRFVNGREVASAGKGKKAKDGGVLDTGKKRRRRGKKGDIAHVCSEGLIKCASGYDFTEVTEEYAAQGESGDLVLVKKKVSSKHIPPDMNALKTLLQGCERKDELASLSDEELRAEKERLIGALLSKPKGKEKEDE